jgi:hypothetical protein
MNSVVRANVRFGQCFLVIGACALITSACVEGDPIPADVVQRAEGVLLEGNLSPQVTATASTSAAPSGSVAPAASSGLPNFGSPPVLPEGDELPLQALDEDAVPEDAIPLSDFLGLE